MQTPSLRQLEYFLAVAEALNFRKAAEACHVTQPALSSQIAQLEATLGLPLFERDKRSVRLTRAGEALLPEAREALRVVGKLCERAQSFGSPLHGPLRLGVIPTVGPYLMPRVLEATTAAFPELQLYLREDYTERLVEQIASGKLDLLLLAIDVDLGGLETLPLFSDPFFVAVNEADELAAREEVGREDLERDDILLLEEGHCLREQTLSLCEASGAGELSGFRGASLATVAQMAAGGLGITILPELAVERETALLPGLRTIPFGADGPYRRIGLAWRASSARADEFRMLAETFSRAYAAG